MQARSKKLGPVISEREALVGFPIGETLLNPRRLELLHVIKEKRPQSAYELAHILGRDLKNVNADLTLLATIGLVELRKTTRGRKAVVPWVTVDKVQVEITI